MATPFDEKRRKQLIKKFHVLLAKSHIDTDGKKEILAAYKVDSTTLLTCAQLIEICDKLNSLLNKSSAELDRERKRVMAAIGGYLRVAGHENNIDIIKAIACRATGIQNFNRIPLERLRNLYAAFTKKAKDFASVDSICAALLAEPATTGNPLLN